jgi:hypothetical protein
MMHHGVIFWMRYMKARLMVYIEDESSFIEGPGKSSQEKRRRPLILRVAMRRAAEAAK